MSANSIDRVCELIEARLAELNDEAKGLESALAGMGDRKAASPSRHRKRPGPKPRRESGGRAPRGQRREQLLAEIKANPGARPSELARAIGVSANQVHVLIRKASVDKLLIRKGKGYAVKS